MARRLLLRLLASAPSASDHVSDAELLRRFASSNDAAAFELILRRHADAVWAACRQILRREADAEDAFQATFLALIRKAKAIRTPCAGGWLHRVAVNAALKLRERNARVSPVEPNQLTDVPAPPISEPDVELIAALHEELARLPERERLPVVLCDLEGLTHADAAQALGWPVGTVSGRLSRARAKLRERIKRHGLPPSATLLPALVAPPRLVPNALSLTTAAAPPAVVSLTEGVLSAMRTAQLKLTAAVLAATGFVALVGFGTVLALAPKPTAIPTAEAVVPPAEGDDAKPDEDKTPKIDLKWRQRPFPSAFPEILPIGMKFLNEFERKHVEPIYETDPPLRKLQKARLRIALSGLTRALDNLDRVPDDVEKIQKKGGGRSDYERIWQPTETLEKVTRDAITLASDLYPTRDSRREWLVLRVAVGKRIEQERKGYYLDNDLPRLEAEIELAKHDKAK
jgi:RNA polymerase sigma factor (sigma-70 family)